MPAFGQGTECAWVVKAAATQSNQGELRTSPCTCHVDTLGHWSSRQSRESSELSLSNGQGQWQKFKVSTTRSLPASKQGHRRNCKCNRRFPGEAVILWLTTQFFPEEVNDHTIDGEEMTGGNLFEALVSQDTQKLAWLQCPSVWKQCLEALCFTFFLGMLRSTGQKGNFLQLRSLTRTYTHTYIAVSALHTPKQPWPGTGSKLSRVEGLSPYGLALPRINGHESHGIDFVRAKNFIQQSSYIITDHPLNFI